MLTPRTLTPGIVPQQQQGAQTPQQGHSTRDKLIALALGTRQLGAGQILNSRQTNRNNRNALAQKQKLEFETRRTTQAAHIARSLIDAKTPQGRTAILDYYAANPVEGIRPQDLERFRDAPDDVLNSVFNRALTVKQRLEQSNTQFDQNLSRDEFGLKQEDTRADNQLARDLGDNTIANTQSQIQDRTDDNLRQDRLADNTVANTQSQIENTQSQIADRNADNTRADAVLAETQRSNQAKEQAALAKNSGRAKPFADAQAKAAVFADRSNASNLELNALEQEIDPTNIRKGAFTSQKLRQYDRAKREFVNAVLRQESGAAIGKEEFTSADKQYFPQFGDSKETIRIKAQARQRAIDGLKAQSQGAHEALFGAGAQQGGNDDLNADELAELARLEELERRGGQ